MLLALGSAALALGYYHKKQMLYYIGAAAMAAFAVLTVYSVYTVTYKTYNKVTQLFTPRSGNEIYVSLFGEPNVGCATILNFQDQAVPKIDYAIWLHFKTCPEELDRILLQLPYLTDTTTQLSVNDGPSENNMWFKPKLLGDTLIEYQYIGDDNRTAQFIYTNLSRTEAYCIDILD